MVVALLRASLGWRFGGQALLVAAALQGEPVDEARRDLGAGFTCAAIERTLVFASNAAGDELAQQKRTVAGVAAAMKDRAVGSAPKKPLRICVFSSEKDLAAFVKERFKKTASGSGYYDLESRTITVRAHSASGYLPRVLAGFWLRDELGVRHVADWIATGLGAFAGEIESPPAMDPSVVWLKAELARDGLPSIGRLIAMKEGEFRLMEHFTIHEAEAKQLFLFLDQKRVLKKFFDELRASYGRDPTGREAVETALVLRTEEIERQFVNRLKALPWADGDRLRAEAKRDLGEGAAVRIDDAFGLAAGTNAEESALVQCVENVRRLRDPLRARFGMTGPPLPVQGLAFKDGESYRAYMGKRYPERAAMGGYYDPVARRLVADLGDGAPVFTHEFCHSVFSDDFGVLPPWLSEGLACLFENYRLEEGVAVGEGDGKLALVRRSVQTGRAPSLARMVALTDAEFHGEDRTSRYMQASAVCLYLQEKGKLPAVYAGLKKARATDPTGAKSLEAACGQAIEKVEDDFRAWIVAFRPK
jgi:hypothetical protein